METAALSFERAWVLQFLWLLPLVGALLWVGVRWRSRSGSPNPTQHVVSLQHRLSHFLFVIGPLALLIVALAGPRLGYDSIGVPHHGCDVVIAMDVSRSMLAGDLVPSRLDRAKLLAQDLISELGGDRIGLVAFAGSAFLQAPLTLDHGAVLTALDELDTSVIPKGGSNIAEAISTAEQAFGKAEGFSRAIVIMSDGEELSADAVSSATQAAASGVRIFTVGVGSPRGSGIPDGAGDFVRDPSTGEIVKTKLDEIRLRQIAEATGGLYTQLDDTAAAKLSVEGIGRMDEAEITESSSRRPIERYQWPLLAALLLVASRVLRKHRQLLFVVFLITGSVWSFSLIRSNQILNSGQEEQTRIALKSDTGHESALQSGAAMGTSKTLQEGAMSENQARALFRSLQGDEGKVNLHEQQDLQEVPRDW